MLKKQNFEQKSSCDIFKSMLDMNVRFFGARKTSHGLTLKRLSDPQPSQRRKPPHLQSTVAYFGVFWAIFTYSLSQARNQSTYVDQIFGECNSYLKVPVSQILSSYDNQKCSFFIFKVLVTKLPFINKYVQILNIFCFRKGN